MLSAVKSNQPEAQRKRGASGGGRGGGGKKEDGSLWSRILRVNFYLLFTVAYILQLLELSMQPKVIK